MKENPFVIDGDWSSTVSTWKGYKYGSKDVDDFMEHVRNAPLDEDAINNIPVLLEAYKRRIKRKELIKLFFYAK